MMRCLGCESVRVRESESERETFEHRHENKSCSACRKRLNERMRACESVCESARVGECESEG